MRTQALERENIGDQQRFVENRKWKADWEDAAATLSASSSANVPRI
ncbi:hypothetical protein [Rhizobium sp. 2MFCol3.1]|nr:hypothetical protein [Rhizobium sp. 2MFCol3.1]